MNNQNESLKPPAGKKLSRRDFFRLAFASATAAALAACTPSAPVSPESVPVVRAGLEVMNQPIIGGAAYELMGNKEAAMTADHIAKTFGATYDLNSSSYVFPEGTPVEIKNLVLPNPHAVPLDTSLAHAFQKAPRVAQTHGWQYEPTWAPKKNPNTVIDEEANALVETLNAGLEQDSDWPIIADTLINSFQDPNLQQFIKNRHWNTSIEGIMYPECSFYSQDRNQTVVNYFEYKKGLEQYLDTLGHPVALDDILAYAIAHDNNISTALANATSLLKFQARAIPTTGEHIQTLTVTSDFIDPHIYTKDILPTYTDIINWYDHYIYDSAPLGTLQGLRLLYDEQGKIKDAYQKNNGMSRGKEPFSTLGEPDLSLINRVGVPYHGLDALTGLNEGFSPAFLMLGAGWRVTASQTQGGLKRASDFLALSKLPQCNRILQQYAQ